MRHTKLINRITLCIALLIACVTAQALTLDSPGIALWRDPAPPDAVLNDGADTITFNWVIKYDTTCSTPYTFEIIDPTDTVIVTQNFNCSASPIEDSYTWNPDGQDCGCYYARIRFYSNWCSGSARKIEDEARVGFLVAPSARFRICKFHDLNGNGIEDPGEPRLAGWSFTVERPLGTVVEMATTGVDGCTDYIVVDAECDDTIQYYIRETVQDGWAKTAPDGATNPITVNLSPGTNSDVVFGNWQPVFITGYKLLDQAPWPWTDPQYVGPEGQTNPPEWEPTPNCAAQPDPPSACISPFQPDQEGIGGVTVTLYESDGTTLVTSGAVGFVNPTTTNADGSYSFGPFQYQQDLVIKMNDPDPSPSDCDTSPEDGELDPWPGDYFGTVATSVWPCPNIDFANPHELTITIPPPVTASESYGCNYFWNNQPSRLWGLFCPTTSEFVSPTIGIDKDGFVYPTPSVNADELPSGYFLYVVPEINVEPQGLRAGTYTLTPPVLPNPSTQSWRVTTYCDEDCSGGSTFILDSGESVEVTLPPGCDVRVDFCVEEEGNNRQCFLPVTFTQQGWHDFSNTDNTIIPGGMLFNKFGTAFATFSYYGSLLTDTMIVGKGKTITYYNTTSSLTRLALFLPQTGTPGKLTNNYVSPWSTTSAGSLAGETIALMMNIAYNDRRLMPRTPGYDLEQFTINSGIYKGRKVGEVLNDAYLLIGGTAPCVVGLSDYASLVEVIQNINANYEWVDYNTYNNRGYLTPNRVLGQPDAATTPTVPFVP
ncbi:MAG: hypothetical protein ABFD49_06560 [Armatimonadota bacterium]|nr:hypothetical protein [bacterium]